MDKWDGNKKKLQEKLGHFNGLISRVDINMHSNYILINDANTNESTCSIVPIYVLYIQYRSSNIMFNSIEFLLTHQSNEDDTWTVVQKWRHWNRSRSRTQGRNYHWTRVDKVQGAPECRGPPSPKLIFFKEQYLVNNIQNPRCNSTLTLRQWLHPSICVMRLLKYATIESSSE